MLCLFRVRFDGVYPEVPRIMQGSVPVARVKCSKQRMQAEFAPRCLGLCAIRLVFVLVVVCVAAFLWHLPLLLFRALLLDL